MKFADFVSIQAIRSTLKADNNTGVIVELVEALIGAGDIKKDDREDIVKAIMQREELGSTECPPMASTTLS